jgi:hypothetical protein
MYVGPSDADADGELIWYGWGGHLPESGAEPAVLQDKIGDDARAVAQGDQCEQGFVTVGLGSDVRVDTQVSEPLVCGSSYESLPWEDEGLRRGGELLVGQRRPGLNEAERGLWDLPGEHGGGNPGWEGCDGKVDLALVEQGEGGCGVAGA